MKTLKTLLTLTLLFIIPIAIWSQNVGIGTTEPNSKLTVVDSLRNTINIKTLDNDKSTGISFQNSGGSYAWNLFRKLNGVNTSDFIISGGVIENDINSLVERFKITKDGHTEIYGGTTLYSTATVNGDFTGKGSVVFNEDSQDKDFRIEGKSKDTLFFVDASINRIGINTNSPSARLHVVGSTKLDGNIIGDITSIEGNVVFNEDSHDKNFRIEGGSAENLFFVNATTNNIGINTNSPSARLHVVGSTELNGNLNIKSGHSTFNTTKLDKDFRILGETSSHLFFADASTNRVGINTGSPDAALDVAGTTKLNGATTINGELTLNGKIKGDFTTIDGNVVFNEDSLDKNFRIEGGSAENLFFVNATTNNIGINTNSPSAKLDVVGTTELNGDLITIDGNVVFNEGSHDKDFRIEGKTKDNLFFIDASTDRIGINTNNPQTDLHVMGDVRIHHSTSGWPIIFTDGGGSGGLRFAAGRIEMTSNTPGGLLARLINGSWSAVSDRRLKKNIVEANGLLAKTLQLNPVNYVFKSDENEENQLGFIAQDVQNVFPEFVIEGDLLTLNYSGLSVAAIGAIKELNEKNMLLESRISALEIANNKLTTQVLEFSNLKDQIKKELLAEMSQKEEAENGIALKR